MEMSAISLFFKDGISIEKTVTVHFYLNFISFKKGLTVVLCAFLSAYRDHSVIVL
jgi:hypothetical protein